MILLLKGLLIWVLAGAVSRLLLGAGLAIVTYTGGKALAEDYLAQVNAAIGGLPADVMAILAMAGVGDALGIIGTTMLVVVSLRAASIAVGRA